MAQFFQRNKRKSVLGLLLLLFGKRRDIGLLLVMLLVLLFIFILPSNFSSFVALRLSRLPGGSLLSAALGVNKPSFGELLAAFKAAREQHQPGWAMFFPPASGSSSLDMVRGGADIGAGDVGARIGGNSTINGILDQDEAGRTPGGVYLRPGDLKGERAGLVQSAFGGVSPFAPQGLFNGAVGAGAFDSLSAALSSTQVPQAGHVIAGGGRLSKAGAARNPLAWSSLAQSVGRGMAGTSAGGACFGGGRCAFSQLTTGHTNAMLSSSPVCTPGSGCPPEYAATQSGVVYDNNQISSTPQVLTSGSAAPQLDGIATANPNPPAQGTADGYAQQANQLQQQEAQCNQADATYDPQEQTLEDQISGLSNSMNNLNCGGGGCSAPGACVNDGNQMKSTCQQLNSVMYAHYQACPIMQQNGPYQPQPCS